MKKEYTNPEMVLIEQKMAQPLMTTSSLGVHDTTINGDQMLAPEANFDLEDDF